jgi:hypothetical protein
MSVKSPQRIRSRLFDVIRQHNPERSFQIATETCCYVDNATVEIFDDRLMIGPRPQINRDGLQDLGDPDSLLWFVARFDDPDFEGRVARFLAKRGIGLPAKWLTA